MAVANRATFCCKASLDPCNLMLLAACLHAAFWLPLIRAETTTQPSARWLDSLLQDFAFRALARPITGVPYDGNPPSKLTGVKVAALWLRSGSMRRRGVSSYKEFHIPVGVSEQPYVKRLVLVYQNLANWSEFYYPLPGYTYLVPVLGLLAYNGSDLSAKYLPELDIQASKQPIRINFWHAQPAPEGLFPKCVYFDIHGSVEFDNLVEQNVCLTTKQGHYSIAVQSITPAPVPVPVPVPETVPARGRGRSRGHGGGGQKGKNNVAWRIVGCVAGGLLLLVSIVLILGCVKKCRHRKRIEMMEAAAADKNVPLLITMVGNTRAPVASGTRTRPFLENDYAT